MASKVSNEIDPIKNERSSNVREVGTHAIWSLSSCKPGIGYIFALSVALNQL